jgi:hypothetical protein
LQLYKLACPVVLSQRLSGRVGLTRGPLLASGPYGQAMSSLPAPSPGAWWCHRQTAQPEEQSNALHNTGGCHKAMEYAIHTLACIGMVLARGICGSEHSPFSLQDVCPSACCEAGCLHWQGAAGRNPVCLSRDLQGRCVVSWPATSGAGFLNTRAVRGLQVCEHVVVVAAISCVGCRSCC